MSIDPTPEPPAHAVLEGPHAPACRFAHVNDPSLLDVCKLPRDFVLCREHWQRVKAAQGGAFRVFRHEPAGRRYAEEAARAFAVVAQAQREAIESGRRPGHRAIDIVRRKYEALRQEHYKKCGAYGREAWNTYGPEDGWRAFRAWYTEHMDRAHAARTNGTVNAKESPQ